MKPILTLAAPLAIAAAVPAQNFPLQGFLFNFDRPTVAAGVSYVTRFGTAAEEHLNRIDRDDYQEWGVNASGQIQIQGFMGWIQDNDDTTRESFGLVGYNEDAANPNFPALATRVLNITGIQMPPTGSPPGGVFYEMLGTFTAPVNFARSGDVFLGVSVPALLSGTPVFDGLWTGAVSNIPFAGVTVFDQPGPRGAPNAAIAQNTYVCYVVNNTARYVPVTATQGAEMLACDWHLGSGMAGGVALARTNQTSYPPSNAPLGTASFLSGLHPDINGLNSGRADDIGFGVTVHNAQAPLGSPVFVLMAFGPFASGPLPITSIGGTNNPETRGNICIDFTTAATFLTTTATGYLTNTGEAQIVVPLSARVRSIINGMPSPVDLWWQGFVLDATSPGPELEIRATGCAIQHLQ
jgi:hypothetical protein